MPQPVGPMSRMLLFSISTSAERVHLHGVRRAPTLLVVQDALVVIVDRDGEDLLRVILADDVADRAARRISTGFGTRSVRAVASRVLVQFLVEDAFADIDARVADIDARAGDEFLDFRVAFAAEGAHREVGGAGHWSGNVNVGCEFVELSVGFCSSSVGDDSSARCRFARSRATLSTRP